VAEADRVSALFGGATASAVKYKGQVRPSITLQPHTAFHLEPHVTNVEAGLGLMTRPETIPGAPGCAWVCVGVCRCVCGCVSWHMRT
jgi:hypothetical protein